jgi:hypothetical protein
MEERIIKKSTLKNYGRGKEGRNTKGKTNEKTKQGETERDNEMENYA